jgi:hypothetical protein
MRAGSVLAILIGCYVLSGAFAQEPMRLPDPPARAAPADSPAPVEEEVKGHALGPTGTPFQQYGRRPAGPDAAFHGYPYSGGWHAGYHHPLWDRPLPLVVPPVSHYQTIWGGGISATQIAPIYPQFGGPGFGAGFDYPGSYRTPPYWPWDTRQFGVYYIRGPW